MSMADEVEKLVGRIYTHFVYRDLAYVGGGVLILAIPFKVYSMPEYLVPPPWWLIVPIILTAYALGFFAQEFGVAFGIFRMFPPGGKFVDQEVASVSGARVIAHDWGESALLYLERITLLKHISAVLGSSSLLTLLFVLQPYWWTGRLKIGLYSYCLGSILLLLMAIVMGVRNWSAASAEQKLIENWSAEVKAGGAMPIPKRNT